MAKPANELTQQEREECERLQTLKDRDLDEPARIDINIPMIIFFCLLVIILAIILP
jgi:hypothetical protein